MATNTISNVKDVGGIIAKAAAGIFEDNLQFCKTIEKADASDYDGKNDYKAGQTVYINLPLRGAPTSTFDQTGTIGDIVETTVPMTLDIISSQAFEVNTLEFATELDLKRLMERVVKPAAVTMAHDFENKVLLAATNKIYNAVGTPGTTVFDTDVILQAREKLNKMLCPKDDNRYFLFDSTAGRSAVNARKGLFQSSTEISQQYKQGYIGQSDGFKWLESEMLQSHTNGNDVTGVTVNATLSTQGVSSIVMTGITNPTGTLKKGQIFTIAGVYAVHPQTRKVYPSLQQFVVTADVAGEAATTRTVSFAPAIYTTGTLQNVDAFPQATAAITFFGSASQAFTKNIFLVKRPSSASRESHFCCAESNSFLASSFAL